MPKMMSINYERIPESDLAENESSHVSVSDRPYFFNKNIRKIVAVFICLFIASGVLFSWYMHERDHNAQLESGVSIYQTSKGHGDRLQLMHASDFKERGLYLDEFHFRPGSNRVRVSSNANGIPAGKVSVDTKTTFQYIIGFGGAFTEAAAHNFFKLPSDVRDEFLELYFGESGIGFSMGRLHINSCDFSLASYSFDDVDGDYKLKHFDHEVSHDKVEIIPLILAAMEKSRHKINLVASPWSPPAWMKVPRSVSSSVSKITHHSDDSGKIVDDLEQSSKVEEVSLMVGSSTPNGLRDDPKTMQAWALYISLFLSAYEAAGVDVWAITPQNEPEFAAPWEACTYNASFESKFVEGFLGPQLRADHPEIKILAFDHNKDHLLDWAQEMLFPEDIDTLSEYVDGMAFHWYGGTGDRLLDGTYGYDTVNATHFLAPDKILLATEGCSCPGVKMGDWLRAERIGHDILYDLNSYAQGWVDWNLLVDHQGGPNHLNNLCDAPVIASSNFTHLHLQPEYFYMGHVSKFVVPGSIRVTSDAVGGFDFAMVHPDVHSGVELGVFPCEQSARQMWNWVPSGDSEFGRIRLAVSVGELVESGNGNASQGVFLCASRGDENRNFLRAWECRPEAATEENDERVARDLVLKMHKVKGTGMVQLVDSNNSECVSLAYGSTESGAILEMKRCLDNDILQLWTFDESHGELTSGANGMCVTAGWPYLSSSAFLTPEGRTVVVVMNEAPVDSFVDISDSVSGSMRTAINAHSIQTIIY